MIRDDGTAYTEGKIVGVERGNPCAGYGTIFTTRGEPLVRVVFAGEAVIDIRSRLGGDDGLDGACTAIIDGIGMVWTVASWTVSAFGVRLTTPGRMLLVTSRPSTMY